MSEACPKCLWSGDITDNGRVLIAHACWSKAKVAIDKIAERTGVTIKRRGYGSRSFACVFSPKITIVFECRKDAEDTTFRISHTFVSGLDADATTQLINAFAKVADNSRRTA
jgi:hypothetical protein